MWHFLKTVLASAVGVLLALIVAGVGLVCWCAWLLAPDGEDSALGRNSVLYIRLEGQTCERSYGSELDALLGETGLKLDLSVLRRAVDRAVEDKRIRGVFLEAGVLASDPASLAELRQLIAQMKESGKPIVAYGDVYTQGAYYVCSVADEMILNPEGMIDWHGLTAETMFYKDVMEKLGLRMEVFKVGDYKSYVEPYTSMKMSEADREQVTSYVGRIWADYVRTVSEARGVSPDTLESIADRYALFMDPKDLLAAGMVDTLGYQDEARSLLRRSLGLDSKDELCLVTPEDMVPEMETSSGGSVAIYYAEGSIVEEGADMPGIGGVIAGSAVVDDLDELERDDDVKAVVVRINSGGGSTYASEQIWHALRKLREKKPVVISMGGMAASGGYYISSAADYIVAQPITLTGSIGIFAMWTDASELLTEKIGIGFDGVKTNKHSDMGTLGRQMDAEERSMVQAFVERGYDLFINRVATGRGMEEGRIREIAGGRVWTGEQAMKVGLVDSLGGLDVAVAKAAELAKMGDDYETVEYPKDEPWYVRLLEEGRDSYFERKAAEELGEYYAILRQCREIVAGGKVQARIPYQIVVK